MTDAAKKQLLVLAILVSIIVILGSYILQDPMIMPSPGSPSQITVVTFTETGLPSGTEWAVSLWNQTGQWNYTSSSDQISFGIPGGIYQFWIGTANISVFSPTALGYNEGGYVVYGSYENASINFGTLGFTSIDYIPILPSLIAACVISAVVYLAYFGKDD